MAGVNQKISKVDYNAIQSDVNNILGIIDRPAIVEKLNQSFTHANIAGELANYQRPGMASFERPYGIAWLLQLTTELRQSLHQEAKIWLNVLAPLEAQAVANISDWLPKLTHPIRTGRLFFFNLDKIKVISFVSISFL